jgi:hypothetical protein
VPFALKWSFCYQLSFGWARTPSASKDRLQSGDTK